jgi:hypothetical protein
LCDVYSTYGDGNCMVNFIHNIGREDTAAGEKGVDDIKIDYG